MTDHSFKVSTPQNLLFQRETLLIFVAVSISLALTSVIFILLWRFFKIGFVWLFSLILIILTRKMDVWKMGVECFYFLSFMLTYSLGPLFTASIIFPAFYIVIKIRPDELQGSLTHLVSLSGVMLTTKYFAGVFGPNIGTIPFLILGVCMFAFWDFIRFLVASKITGQHWIKLFISFITGIVVNYFYFSTFAYHLLQFLQSI